MFNLSQEPLQRGRLFSSTCYCHHSCSSLFGCRNNKYCLYIHYSNQSMEISLKCLWQGRSSWVKPQLQVLRLFVTSLLLDLEIKGAADSWDQRQCLTSRSPEEHSIIISNNFNCQTPSVFSSPVSWNGLQGQLLNLGHGKYICLSVLMSKHILCDWIFLGLQSSRHSLHWTSGL